MADDKILKKVLQNLGQIAAETGKEAVKEAGKITESIITGKELLGDIKPLTEAELSQKKAEDEREKQKQISDVRSQMSEPARNVEAEIEQVRKEKEQEEEQKEKEFLENLKRQREAEEAERQQLSGQNEVSSNPAKRKKSRGSAFVGGGKKKTQQPDPSQMSQTNEMTGGKID